MDRSRLLLIFALILTGFTSRILPHPPNFTAINALAIFSGIYFPQRWLSLAIVLAPLIFSDFFLGFHSTLFFVYLSFSLVALASSYFSICLSSPLLILYTLASSLFFFLVSNFGVWFADSIYTKDLAGLFLCYVAAIPFLKNQIAADFIYISIILIVKSLAQTKEKSFTLAKN